MAAASINITGTQTAMLVWNGGEKKYVQSPPGLGRTVNAQIDIPYTLQPGPNQETLNKVQAMEPERLPEITDREKEIAAEHSHPCADNEWSKVKPAKQIKINFNPRPYFVGI